MHAFMVRNHLFHVNMKPHDDFYGVLTYSESCILHQFAGRVISLT